MDRFVVGSIRISICISCTDLPCLLKQDFLLSWGRYFVGSRTIYKVMGRFWPGSTSLWYWYGSLRFPPVESVHNAFVWRCHQAVFIEGPRWCHSKFEWLAGYSGIHVIGFMSGWIYSICLSWLECPGLARWSWRVALICLLYGFVSSRWLAHKLVWGVWLILVPFWDHLPPHQCFGFTSFQ